MKVIHIVVTATLFGFALLGWLINYGTRSHATMLQRNRQETTFMKMRISELAGNVKNLEGKMVSRFPQPSPPSSSSSNCAFDMLANGGCTLLKGNHLRVVNGKLSANQGNGIEDQSKRDSDAPDLRSAREAHRYDCFISALLATMQQVVEIVKE
jgi:hypothetical protein